MAVSVFVLVCQDLVHLLWDPYSLRLARSSYFPIRDWILRVYWKHEQYVFQWRREHKRFLNGLCFSASGSVSSSLPLPNLFGINSLRIKRKNTEELRHPRYTYSWPQ
ncbi:hypothetical protein AX14_005865 [Amanita brunnescens Koide BX004]|nr:hypothetical protein AX14_005865 [Amanita brunnescens Koide BX004]